MLVCYCIWITADYLEQYSSTHYKIVKRAYKNWDVRYIIKDLSWRIKSSNHYDIEDAKRELLDIEKDTIQKEETVDDLIPKAKEDGK